MEAMKKAFSPEFRNRLDSIISFGALPESVVLQIVTKFVAELEVKLLEKKVTLELTDKAKEYLAHKGYEPAYGARPLSRLIQNELKRPLADELLFGKLVKGGHVEVDSDDSKLLFKYSVPVEKSKFTKKIKTN
jgi:ATP-dependent Clp protease ATP-binding subunit ClpA